MRWGKRISISLLMTIYYVSYLCSNRTRGGEKEASAESLQTSHLSLVQMSRLSTLEAACEELKTGKEKKKGLFGRSPRHFLDGYVYDSSSRLAYCHIPKVASTYWLSNFAKLSGAYDKVSDERGGGGGRDLSDGELHRLMLANSTKSVDLPSDAFAFIFVRHPLKRLVSAYVDKFVMRKDKDFLRPLLRYLRLKSEAPMAKRAEINFPTFVDYVLDELKTDKLSFGTFHWMPYYRLCNICNVRLSAIGKLETMKEDLRFLEANIPSLKPLLESTKRSNSIGIANLKPFLKQLSPGVTKELCQLYEPDFKMFNYACDLSEI